MKNILLTSKKDKPNTIVTVGKAEFGKDFVVIAGPCSVETEEQFIATALIAKEGGAHMLRGGVFKPRTSPYAFQGLGLPGLKLMAKGREVSGLPFVTEVVDPRDVSWVCEYADMLQIGARNMQNFSLLKEVGKSNKPVLLKRGMYSTIEEWLNSAEYILAEGNPNVVLCERGIRTFETYTRNTLDLNAVAAVRKLTHLPIIADPSHGVGRPELVADMSCAAAAAGAQGIIVEVHNNPEEALSDKDQALTASEYKSMMIRLKKLTDFLKLNP